MSDEFCVGFNAAEKKPSKVWQNLATPSQMSSNLAKIAGSLGLTSGPPKGLVGVVVEARALRDQAHEVVRRGHGDERAAELEDLSGRVRVRG